MSNRDDYIAKLKLQLDALNGEIDTLETKVSEAKQDVQKGYHEEMRKLRHEAKLADAKLDELKAATAETWESLVAETEKVRDAFVHSFNYFKSQL